MWLLKIRIYLHQLKKKSLKSDIKKFAPNKFRPKNFSYRKVPLIDWAVMESSGKHVFQKVVALHR